MGNVKEILKSLHTSINGLSTKEAEKRLKIYGLNEIEEEKYSTIKFLIKTIINPINVMIFFAAIISYFIGHIYDFYIILALLLINIFISFFQEYKSEKYLKSLKEKLKMKVKVKRDGKWMEIDSKYLVPGDIIKIKSGDVILADLVLIEGKNVLIDESPITGESLPKEKEVGDKIFASSIVKRGKGIAVVVSTGIHTKYGKLINIVQKEKEKSNLEKNILKIGAFLLTSSLILISILTIKLLYLGYDFREILFYDLALLVASIPSALPTVISSILLVSSYFLAKENILVRRLSSIFDLSQMNMLATDKTGTLTENKVKLSKIYPIKKDIKEIILYSYLASDPESGDPIDSAIKEAFEENGLKVPENIKIVKFIPYDSIRKYSEVIIEIEGKKHSIKKGSAEILLKEIKDSKKYFKILEDLYNKGYRVLALTFDNNLIGFLCFYDPPRKDAKEFIRKLKNLGIKIKLLTGDSKEVALKIGKEVGIGNKVVNREELHRISDQHFKYLVEKYDIFAEIYPEDKYKIVKELKNLGYVVGVTGDGVNDIGAFKVSNVGISVYNSVQAAKEFSDLILTAPGLKQLIEAIKKGREAFIRLENYIIYRISENIRFPIFTILLTLLLGIRIPPLFLLLLTILNDIPILAIAFDKVSYSEKPERFYLKKIITISGILGIIGTITSSIYLYLIYKVLSLKHIEILLFLKLLLTGHFLLFVIRSRDSYWLYNPPKGILLYSTVGTQIVGSFIVYLILANILCPLYSFLIILFTWIYSLICLQINDIIKVCLYKYVMKE